MREHFLGLYISTENIKIEEMKKGFYDNKSSFL